MQKKIVAIAFSIAFAFFSFVGGSAIASPTSEGTAGIPAIEASADNTVAVLDSQSAVSNVNNNTQKDVPCPRYCPGGTALCHDTAGTFCSCCAIELILPNSSIEPDELEATPESSNTAASPAPQQKSAPTSLEASNSATLLDSPNQQSAPMSIFTGTKATLPESLQLPAIKPFPGSLSNFPCVLCEVCPPTSLCCSTGNDCYCSSVSCS